MRLLALRLCEHDSNISYFDGSTVRYYKSERTTQVKHHAYNDLHAWKNDIEDIFNISVNDLDEIAIVVDPWSYKGLPEFADCDVFPAIPWHWLETKCPSWRVNHHYAHALSGWMLTDKPDVSIVIDGFGDLDKAWSVFKGDQFIAEGSQKLNGSIGVSMADAGRTLGVNFGHVSDIAGKVMGLQSYGTVDKKYLTELKQYTMLSINDVFSFDNWRTYKQDDLIANHTRLDWIATVHERLGDILVDFFYQYCKKDDVVFYSGGVAQNVIWNTKLLKEFPNLVVPPHSTDEGLSLGALEWMRVKNNLPKFTLPNFPFVQSDTAPLDEPSLDIIKEVARLLSIGKTVAWYQGHGEVGPRALGNRSILMHPNLSKTKINAIKRRENYRPFGASILKEHMKDYFIDDINNPHMLFVSELRAYNTMNAIRHVDNTCRVQTVDENSGSFRILLKEFCKESGYPILLNTSLNLAGKPIAGHMQSAEELFHTSELDCLVIGNEIYLKVDDETKMG